MTLTTKAIERALAGLSTRSVLDLDRRRSRLGYDQLQEIEHQFQIAIEGTATPNLTWEYFDLPFDVEFFFAPQQRDSPLVVPHFTYGASVSGSTTPSDAGNPHGQVGVFCNVVRWAQDARKAVTGARVGVGVICGYVSGQDPAAASVDFDGWVHITFQGYGAPGENSSVETPPADTSG